jgi:hypothetical protein
MSGELASLEATESWAVEATESWVSRDRSAEAGKPLLSSDFGVSSVGSIESLVCGIAGKTRWSA